MRPSGFNFRPPTPVDGLRPRGAGLVWRLRAVPRTHGTRAALGLRPAGYYGPPARSSLTVEGPSPRREARPDAGLRLTGGEGDRHEWSAERRARSDCLRNARRAARRASGMVDAPVGAPLPSFFRRGKPDDGVPGAANNTGGGALASVREGWPRQRECFSYGLPDLFGLARSARTFAKGACSKDENTSGSSHCAFGTPWYEMLAIRRQTRRRF